MNVRYDLPDYFDLDMNKVLHGLGPRFGMMSHLWCETDVHHTQYCLIHQLLICFETDKVSHLVFYVEDFLHGCYGVLDVYFNKSKSSYTTRFHTVRRLEDVKGNIERKIKVDGKKYSMYLIYALYVRMIRELFPVHRVCNELDGFVSFERYFTYGLFKDHYHEFLKPKHIMLYSKYGFNYKTLFFTKLDTRVMIRDALSSAENWKANEQSFYKDDNYNDFFRMINSPNCNVDEVDVGYLYSFEELNGKVFHIFSVMDKNLTDECGYMLGVEIVKDIPTVAFNEGFGDFAKCDVQVFNVNGNEYWIDQILFAMKRYAPELSFYEMLNSEFLREYMQYYKIAIY